jgi:serine/threonine protein kinase
MDVTAEQWQIISGLLDEALDLPSSARESWFASLHGTRAEYRLELRRLLDRHAEIETSDFLMTMPQLGAASIDAQHPMGIGTLVGPYVIEAEAGRGGMGIVYRARRSDGTVKRAVALKLLHSPFASSELIARFARERDILAGLTHPHIARLYDAGVAQSGQPYIALEYVEGLPLAVFCDAQRMPVASRLTLMLQVLHAVQFAHANLVIHRDLKPSNILVCTNGQVHLLDFGIAKPIPQAGDHDPELTQRGVRVLTPEYASPEQIRGDAVSTATDIYSLGVLFYELLCGVRPYRPGRATVAALEESILFADPVRPSQASFSETEAVSRSTTIRSLGRTLAGDLDCIVLKAIRKNSHDRYATADAFAQDIERFLRGAPVVAQPDSWRYRTRKILRRNALAAAASLVVAVSLAAGLAVALWQAQRANEEAHIARAVQSFMREVFEANSKASANPLRAQQTTARELLDIGTSTIDTALADLPRGKLEVLATFASMYHDLGLDEKALALQQRRVALARQVYGDRDRHVAEALRDMSLIVSDTSHSKERLAILTEALGILDRSGDRTSVLRANVLGDLAQYYSEFNLTEALRYAHESRALLQGTPPSEDMQEAFVMEGTVLNEMARFREAEPLLLQAVSVSKRAFGDPNPHLAHIYTYLGERDIFSRIFPVQSERIAIPSRWPTIFWAPLMSTRCRSSRGSACFWQEQHETARRWTCCAMRTTMQRQSCQRTTQ